jgi:outer membrane biosynthesis protein TonB
VNKKLKFAIEDIELLDESNDSQFATLKIDAFASGNNRHSLYISEETLRASAKTILEKPIVWQYDAKKNDAMSHEKDEYAVGFIPKDTTIDFNKLEDGRIMMTIVGKLWTRYSGKLMEVFNRDRSKSVSVEIEVIDQQDTSDFGIPQILSYCYSCITILGQMIKPAIDGAKADLLAFAEKEEKEYQNAYELEFSNKYSDIDFTIPKELKSAAKKSLETYKDTGESANSVSLAMARFIVKNEKITADKVRAMAKYFNQKTEKTNLAIGLYGGKTAAQWSKEIVNSMNAIDEKRLSYFKDREILTFPYEKISDINPALKGIRPPISLSQANEIASQADAIGGEYGWPTAINSFKKRYHVENGHWIKNKSLKKEELSVKDENEKDLEVKEEAMAEEKLPETETAPEEEKMSEKTEEMAAEEKKDEEKETPAEEDKEEPKEKDEPKEEKMSLDANLDMAALMQMLVDETEDNRELADKYTAGEEMNYALLCSAMYKKMCKMAEESVAAKEDKDVYMAENAKLKEYKDKIEKQQFDYAVEKTLQEVSDVFSKDEIDTAREEVKAFSVETLPAWQSDIKSKAFSRIKDNPKKKENFTRMATVNSWLNINNESSEDVSKKYAKEGWLPKN